MFVGRGRGVLGGMDFAFRAFFSFNTERQDQQLHAAVRSGHASLANTLQYS